MTDAAINEELLTENCNQYLTFLLGTEEFALPIMKVKEIIRHRTLTTVPMAPSFIRGAINLRGNVVPVIDLEKKFELNVSEITSRTCVVIVEVTLADEYTTIGVVVSRVLETLEIDDTYIEPPPKFGALIRSDFIKGMGRVDQSDEKFIIIMDVDRILSTEEVAVVGGVGSSNDDIGEQAETIETEEVEPGDSTLNSDDDG